MRWPRNTLKHALALLIVLATWLQTLPLAQGGCTR